MPVVSSPVGHCQLTMVIHELDLQLGTPLRYPDIVFLLLIFCLGMDAQSSLRIQDTKINALDRVDTRRFAQYTEYRLS